MNFIKKINSKWVSTKMIASCENIETNKKTLFQRLFAYISGQNDKNQKIDMTAPVLTEVINMGQSCQIKMRFLIPKVLQNNTPVPTGDAVLEQFSEMTVAVNQFSGLATMNDYIAHHALLVQRLGNDAVQYDTTTMLTAGYNAPYQIINRTNEVWFRKN
jgi:hypothetical protein